jgi:hypothetical protein
VQCLGPRLDAAGVFIMERSFSVEAKSFRLSAKIGCPNLRLEERRKGFVGYIFASVQCSEWLVETVESAIQSQVKEEIAKTFREGDKAMMVHGGGNKAGRFLEVSFLAVGGRKGVIWLPEGRFGRGWRRFAGELRRLLEAQRLAVGAEKVGDSSVKAVSGSSPGVDPKRSYVQALCATPAVEERAAPLRFLDLFPVPTHYESRTVGEDLRVAVDCAAMEGFRPSSMEAAGSAGASGLGAEVEEVKKLLGLLDFKLDRIITGLSLRPSRWRKKLRVLGLDFALDRETGPVIDENLDLGLNRCVGSDLVPGLDPDVLDPGSEPTKMGSKPGLDPGFDLASDLKPVSCSWMPGDPSGLATIQELSPRAPELSTEPSPNSPEPSTGFTLTHDSGDDAGALVVTSTGDLGDISAQGGGFRRISQVSFPDFPLPWEDVLSVSSNGESDSGASVSVDLAGEASVSANLAVVSPPVKSLIKRGFFGPRAAAPSTVVAVDLDSSLCHPVSSISGISKSELGYFRRVKDKVAKQLNKNKELLAEAVMEIPDKGAEDHSIEVQRTFKMASVMGVTWGGDDKKMLNLLSAKESERKAKGIRELKNLDCSVSPVKSQRRRGRAGSKNVITFPPEVH